MPRKKVIPKRNRLPASKRSDVRSGFEFKTLKHLTERGIAFTYESEVIPYSVPASTHKYTPDFIVTTITGKKLYLECKGLWDRASRKKMELVVQQHPELDIRMVLMRDNKLTKVSKTSYTQWAAKRGIKCCVSPLGHIPLEWLEE